MIILDTNVVSELLRRDPDRNVIVWLERQAQSALFTTAITRGEILYGIRLLREGKRRKDLLDAASAVFDNDLTDRVVEFDAKAADLYAEIGATRRALGRPISQFDAMIAAISRSHAARLATRNVEDFDHCGVEVINPWGTGRHD